MRLQELRRDSMNIHSTHGRCDEANDLHQATLVSQRLHQNQQYNGKPYFDGHVLPVIKTVKKLGGNEFQQMIAALHDVVEDGHLDLGAIRSMFGADMGEAIDAISRRSGETYFEYINRVIQNPAARLVKQADLMVNIGNNPPASLLKRYEKALQLVSGEESDIE